MMHSNLTRRAFRQLLAGKPVVCRRHLHQHLYHPPRLRHLPRNGRITLSNVPSRPMFNLFGDNKRDVRTPRLEPGMEKMLELDKRLHLSVRPPKAEELAMAFKLYMNSKDRDVPKIEDSQAILVLQTAQTLEEMNEQAKIEGKPLYLSVEQMYYALEIVSKAGTVSSLDKRHNELARVLMRMILKEDPSPPPGKAVPRLQHYLTVLCSTGDSLYAREVVEAFWRKNISTKSEDEPELWSRVLRGLSRENKEDELERTIDLMAELKVVQSKEARRIMVSHYAKKDDWQKVQSWATQAAYEPGEINPWLPDTDFRILLEFCLRNHKVKWGEQFLEAEIDPASPPTWDFVLGAAATIGKSVDEIDRMMSVLVRRSKESGEAHERPNTRSFNNLMRHAISNKDPYKAERYWSLLQKWGATPNAETYILQVRYRLLAGDISGALASYHKLLDQEFSYPDQDYLITQELVIALSKSSSSTNKKLLNLIENLVRRPILFQPELVHALCIYHLKRDEYFEVVDLLQTYSHEYSTAERIRIRDVLVDYTFDPKTDLGRAWDTYMIFVQVFDAETKRDLRNRAVSLFFRLGRPDLATHVFTTMSNHARQDSRPDTETYIRAFEGTAVTGAPEALEVIHNLMKLDTTIEPGTRLRNALMIAYAGCDNSRRAISVWREIAMSEEGPSYESLLIAFRACENFPYGYEEADSIWERLRKTDVVIDKNLFVAYLGALGGNQLYERVADELIPKMEEICGEKPDFEVLATFYNTALDVDKQEKIEEWAANNYSEIWQEMQEKGINENEIGFKRVDGLDRSLRP